MVDGVISVYSLLITVAGHVVIGGHTASVDLFIERIGVKR